MEKLDINQFEQFLRTTGVNILTAIVILFIGLKIARMITTKLNKAMEKKGVDASLRPFLTSVTSWLLKVCVFITAISSAGVQTTSFIAILGTAGLAIGMALQGSLSNFAGGVLILILKPFKVGDVISAQGHTGSVDKITTFCTFLKTPDNKVICIPNGALANSSIVNINQEETRRVDFSFGIGYGDSISEAKAILEKLVTSDARILKDPTHQIVVGELADSSVNIFVRTWVKTSDYWGVFFELTEKVKTEFDQNKISIPYPQTDIHLHQLS